MHSLLKKSEITYPFNHLLIFYGVPLTSLDDIRERFGIFESASAQEVRRELKELIRNNHPDATSGGFISAEQEATYHAAREAAELIDNLPEQGLASLSASSEQLELVRSEIQTVSEKQENFEMVLQDIRSKLEESAEKSEQGLRRESASSRIDELETSTSRYIDSKVKEIHLKAYIPVVTFTALSVIFAALLFLPQRIGDNQALQQLIDVQSVLFTRLWLTSFVLVAVIWLISWYLESRYRRSYETLARNYYQEDLFRRFTRFMRSFPNIAKGQYGFSKSDLARFIYASLRPHSSPLLFSWLDRLHSRQHPQIEDLISKAEFAKREYDKAVENLNDAKREFENLRRKKNAIDNDRKKLNDPEHEKSEYDKITDQMHHAASITKSAERAQRVKIDTLRTIFEEFKGIPVITPLFPHLTQILDPEIAQRLSEIMLQKGLLKGSLEEQAQSGSIDDWYTWT